VQIFLLSQPACHINTKYYLQKSPSYTTYKYSLLNADASTPPLGLSLELANPSDFTNLPSHTSSGMRNTYVTTRLPGVSSSSNFAEIFAFPLGRRYENTTVASFTETSNAEACSMRTRSLAPAVSFSADGQSVFWINNQHQHNLRNDASTRTSFDARARQRTRRGVNFHPDASRASFRRRRDAHASIVTPQVVDHIVRSDVGKVERAANHELRRGADWTEVFIIGGDGVRHDGRGVPSAATSLVSSRFGCS